MMSPIASDPSRIAAIRGMNRAALVAFVEEAAATLQEDEALAILRNAFCTTEICGTIAQNPRLVSRYSVLSRLVAHRATPQVYAMTFVHHLHWPDLVRFSTDVRIHPAIRRAIDRRLANKVVKLTLGEKIAVARACAHDLITVLIHDPSLRVFEALLQNSRLREEDLLVLIASGRANRDKLGMIGDHRQWSMRYEIRFALVRHADTPRAVAARHVMHLKRQDLLALLDNAQTSVYIRRCAEQQIEAMERETAAASEQERLDSKDDQGTERE